MKHDEIECSVCSEKTDYAYGWGYFPNEMVFLCPVCVVKHDEKLDDLGVEKIGFQKL